MRDALDTLPDVRPEECAERTRCACDAACGSSHWCPPACWSSHHNLGINAVYGYLRREQDPLPHIRQGRDYRIDDALAVAWMRREFGVNTGTE